MYSIANIAVSSQIVMRDDDVKLLCFCLLVVIQCLMVSAYAILFFPGRWINHRDPRQYLREKLKAKFGSAIHHYDESMPNVETVDSQSMSSEEERALSAI